MPDDFYPADVHVCNSHWKASVIFTLKKFQKRTVRKHFDIKAETSTEKLKQKSVKEAERKNLNAKQ